MGNVYALIWLIIAIILIVRFRKESRSVYLLGGYFIVLSIWWFANELTEVDLMHGVWSWGIRSVSIAVLAAAVVFYYLERKRQSENEKPPEISDRETGNGDNDDNN